MFSAAIKSSITTTAVGKKIGKRNSIMTLISPMKMFIYTVLLSAIVCEKEIMVEGANLVSGEGGSLHQCRVTLSEKIAKHVRENCFIWTAFTVYMAGWWLYYSRFPIPLNYDKLNMVFIMIKQSVWTSDGFYNVEHGVNSSTGGGRGCCSLENIKQSVWTSDGFYNVEHGVNSSTGGGRGCCSLENIKQSVLTSDGFYNDEHGVNSSTGGGRGCCSLENRVYGYGSFGC